MKLDNESRVNLLEDKIEQLTQRINHLEDERDELYYYCEGSYEPS